MRICAVVKYPPIQGGVSAQSYWLCRALAEKGHDVTVVTNAAEVEPGYRIWLEAADLGRLQGRFPGGGRLDVVWTSPWDEGRWHHIPAGNPASERLASLAAETVRQRGSDLILSYYLQPYGIAAAYASRVTGVPFVTRHAGSDRYALMKNPELGPVYRQVLREAGGIIANGDTLAGFGIPAARLIDGPAVSFMPESFAPDGAALGIQAAIDRMARLGCPAITSRARLAAGRPVIGLYGKVGRAKGTMALLEAAAAVKPGRRPAIVMMGGGILMPRVRQAVDSLGLAADVWTLPFLPHWRVPEFIRACDVIAVLEHGFPIPQHGPSLMREVLACGVPVLASGEVTGKLAAPLQSAAAITTVADPRDGGQLRRAMAAALAAASGERPAAIPGLVAESRRELDGVISRIEAFAAALPVPAVARVPAPAGPGDDDAAGLARGLLARYAPGLVAVALRESDDWLARLAGTPAETVPARLVALVDEAMARHRDDPRWQVVQAEADLLWLACDTGSPDGAAPPGEPEGALPPAVARAEGWTDAEGSYAACPQSAAMVRLRVYPPAALRFLLSRRETVLRARPGDTAPAAPAVPADRDCAVVVVKDQALEGRVFLASRVVHAVLRQADGTRTPAVLARETGIPEARLTALLDGLARAGLIRWTCYPQPRVAAALRLVPAGR
ncbi:MAG TPA: glycosyltransferase [Streptosporangiaceae bacterium]|nr:glycosyltransferase [Streptosporangiaceae bacterium]